MEKPFSPDSEYGQVYDLRRARVARCAVEMGKLFISGHDAEQTSEFLEAQRGYLWAQHELNESEKFDPPFYSDHRFC